MKHSIWTKIEISHCKKKRRKSRRRFNIVFMLLVKNIQIIFFFDGIATRRCVFVFSMFFFNIWQRSDLYGRSMSRINSISFRFDLVEMPQIEAIWEIFMVEFFFQTKVLKRKIFMLQSFDASYALWCWIRLCGCGCGWYEYTAWIFRQFLKSDFPEPKTTFMVWILNNQFGAVDKRKSGMVSC